MPTRPQPAADGSEEADDLFELAPEEFVAARDALVRRLRAAGAREEAAAVHDLRRPSPTAWALNQVARHEPEIIKQALDAGTRLRSSMQDAVGGDASGLRRAEAEDRSAVVAVLARAVSHLAQHGQMATDAMERRMAATVRAAAIDPEVADRLRRGVLQQDAEVAGFGLEDLAGTLVVPGAATFESLSTESQSADPGSPEQQESGRRSRAEHAERVAAVERLERRAARLRAASDDAERRAVDRRAEADAARAEADVARAEAEEARRLLERPGQA